MSKRQSSLIFVLSLVISGIILLQMGFYVLSILAGWNMKFNLIAVCHSWLKAIGLSSLKYVLDGLVIYTLLLLLWKIGSQFIQTARMKRRFQPYKEANLTTELSQTYGSGKEEILVLSHPTPMAFTMGFVNPRIIVTTGLIHFLTQEELKAVISHEMYHKKNRDPLKVFLLSLSSSMMWYIPIQKWFHQQYQVIQEVLADEYAIKQQETSVNLGSALLKMLKLGRQEKMPFTYVSFAATSVNYRIEYMLNPLKGIQLRLPLKILFISLTIFSLICGLFIYALA
ncbi:M56 family metallopeptidase [Bacillus sp. FJAT-50079]|uniref:M56 family metallopeptidase n=1 Tax=Bacillus sp. FJAT-50079 TaxID=2833577 RepID=UPI001BC91C76|nr:M56 family metallopeptidase [Bacillus sp. FJAT-50079]MBS4210601.1 M56 family metallopeptidase [Bacillus sp. FJAT-50079]